MISVITVTFNAAATLEETLISLNKQTYRDFEVVAVDGGSTDGTVALFRKYGDMIGTLISEKDKGVYDAMNKGVKAAKGDILFFLNAQDTLYSDDVFEKVVEAFASPKRPYVVFGDAFFTNRQNFPESELTLPPNTRHSFKDSGPREPGICHQCLFYRKELFDKLGGYNLKYRIYGDFDFNIRVFDFCGDRYQYVPKVIANFDLGGLSTRTNSKYFGLMNQENMELRAKYETMKARTRWRKFLFSHAHAPWDGGYYVQALGLRLDWTAWKKMFSLLPQSLPFDYDLAYGIPDGVDFSGMENVLNGVAWLRGDHASVAFGLQDRTTRIDLDMSVRLAVSVRRRGMLAVVVRVNGQDVGEMDYSSYCNGEQRDNLLRIRLPKDTLRHGKNVIELRVTHDETADATFGLQRLSIGPHKPLAEVKIGRPLDFSSAGMKHNPCRTHGMYSPEDWGAWLHAKAAIDLRVPAGGLKLRVASEWRVFVFAGDDKRQIDIFANEHKVVRLEFTGRDGFPAKRSFDIPREMIGDDGVLRLKIVAVNPVIPAEVNPGLVDTRVLSVALSKLTFAEE